MEVNGQLHTITALTPGKVRGYPLDRRVGGLQGWYGWMLWKREKSLLLLGMENSV
jgi:hypothetical protein